MSRRHPVGLAKVAATLAALALVGCGGGGGSAKPPTATAAVTPESGGTVTLADNSARLEIPAGAVSSTTMITVSTSTQAAPSGVQVDGQILKFEPDGLVFEKPVTVTFQIKSATHPTVYWSNSSGGFDAIGGTVTGSSIAAQVTHFSSGFVADAKGASADCAPGMACGVGASCSYGGGNTNTGTPMSGADASAGPIDPGGGAGGTSTGGDKPPASGGSEPGPIDPGSPGPSKTSALTSDVAMCCACVNGEYYCTACGSKPGAGGPCAEGAACSQQGATCANSPVSAGGGGGTNTGGADAGAPIDPGSAGGGKPPASGAEPIAPSKTGALSSDGAAAPTCCTCGADGLFHCGGSCPGNTNTGGGADAGMSGGADASTRPSDPGPIGDGKCGQGGVCQPGSAPCSDASPTSCTKCDCGADGHYVCTPCSTGGPADAGVPIDPGAGECVPGGICQPGSAGCGSGSSGGACMKCDCGADGHYKCSPCAGGADAGAPPPPQPQPIQQCVQGGACSVQGQGCGAGDIGTCMKCMCEADLQLACSPC